MYYIYLHFFIPLVIMVRNKHKTIKEMNLDLKCVSMFPDMLMNWKH